MSKKIVLCLMLCFCEVGAVDFMQVVTENAHAPFRLVSIMKELCQETTPTGQIAVAFLEMFGGDDFNPIVGCESNTYEEPLLSQLQDAALQIGRSIRRIYQFKDVNDDCVYNLRIALRFMTFARDVERSHQFLNTGISNSYGVNELRGMISAREEYLRAIKEMQESMQENMDQDIELCELDECLSDIEGI